MSDEDSILILTPWGSGSNGEGFVLLFDNAVLYLGISEIIS